MFAGPLSMASNVLKNKINKNNAENYVVMVKPYEVYQDNLGIASSDEIIKGNKNDIYFMASIGKILAARTAIEYFKDKENGLDSKISDLLSDYPEKMSNFIDKLKLNPNFSRITIADLLRHTSGIGQFTQESFAQLTKRTNEMLSSEEILDLETEQNSEYGKFSYSNTGYELLALILERHSKKKFEDLERDLVLKPLKLENEIFLRDQIDKTKISIVNRSDLNLILGKNFDKNENAEHNILNLPFRAGAGIYANPYSVSKLATKIWDKDSNRSIRKI